MYFLGPRGLIARLIIGAMFAYTLFEFLARSG